MTPTFCKFYSASTNQLAAGYQFFSLASVKSEMWRFPIACNISASNCCNMAAVLNSVCWQIVSGIWWIDFSARMPDSLKFHLFLLGMPFDAVLLTEVANSFRDFKPIKLSQCVGTIIEIWEISVLAVRLQFCLPLWCMVAVRKVYFSFSWLLFHLHFKLFCQYRCWALI